MIDKRGKKKKNINAQERDANLLRQVDAKDDGRKSYTPLSFESIEQTQILCVC